MSAIVWRWGSGWDSGMRATCETAKSSRILEALTVTTPPRNPPDLRGSTILTPSLLGIAGGGCGFSSTVVLTRDRYDHRVTAFLVEAQEWSKLECWARTIWMVWPPGTSGVPKEDLDRWMLLLFRPRPGAAQKLEQWTERWCHKRDSEVLGSPRRDYQQAHEVTRRVTS